MFRGPRERLQFATGFETGRGTLLLQGKPGGLPSVHGIGGLVGSSRLAVVPGVAVVPGLSREPLFALGVVGQRARFENPARGLEWLAAGPSAKSGSPAIGLQCPCNGLRNPGERRSLSGGQSGWRPSETLLGPYRRPGGAIDSREPRDIEPRRPEKWPRQRLGGKHSARGQPPFRVSVAWEEIPVVS